MRVVLPTASSAVSSIVSSSIADILIIYAAGSYYETEKNNLYQIHTSYTPTLARQRDSSFLGMHLRGILLPLVKQTWT
jgi:hypothetical protein